jgi:hypothetical protein
VDTGDREVFAYRRFVNGASGFLVVLNFGDRAHTLDFTFLASSAEIILSTTMTRSGKASLAMFKLASNEGVVLRLPSS